jgi:hypothetical protein
MGNILGLVKANWLPLLIGVVLGRFVLGRFV